MPSRLRPTALLAPVLATVTGVLPAFLAGGLAVQISAEFGIGEGAFGLAFALYFATAAVSSAWLGRFAERMGARTGLFLAPLVGLVVQLAIAGLARDYGTFIALLAVAGATNALAQPAANLALARAVPSSSQGFAFGLKQSAIPIATLLGGLAVPLFAVTVGWRWAFVAGAGVAALAALASIVAPPPDPRGPGSPTSPSRPPLDATTLTVLALGIGLGGAAAGALAAFLVSTGVDAGLSESSAGAVLTVGSACGLLVRLGAGVAADRVRVRPLRIVVGMLALGTPAFAALAFRQPVLHVLATPLAFGAGWAWPGLFNLAVVRAFPGAPARATGITQTGTYVGAVVGPLAFGGVAEWSYFAAWMGATALMVGATIIMLVADRRLAASTRDA